MLGCNLDNMSNNTTIATLKRGSRRGASRTTPFVMPTWASSSPFLNRSNRSVEQRNVIIVDAPYSLGGNTPVLN